MSQSKPNGEERHRIIQDALRHASIHNIIAETPEEALVNRAKEIVRTSMGSLKLFVDSAGPLSNLNDLRTMLSEDLITKFRTFDKEELLFIVVLLHVEALTEELRAL